MSLITLRGIAGIIILFMGRELSFLFSAAMAAFLGTRLTFLLPPSLPAWADTALILSLALLGAALTLINQESGFYICGFLIGGFAFTEYFAPRSPGLPLLPFMVGSIIGAVFIGLLKEWALIVVSALIGTYLLYGVLPVFGLARILASGGLFIIGALIQVILFQMQKRAEQ